MPCLFVILVAAFPRVAIALLYFFTTYFDKAINSLLVLILGFLFLPLTTIVYAWIINAGHAIDGLYLIALIVAVFVDLGLIGHGEYSRRSRI